MGHNRRAKGSGCPQGSPAAKVCKPLTSTTYASLNKQAHSLGSTRTKHSPFLQMGTTSSTSRETNIKILLHKLQHVSLYLNKNWGKGKTPSQQGRKSLRWLQRWMTDWSLNFTRDTWSFPSAGQTLCLPNRDNCNSHIQQLQDTHMPTVMCGIFLAACLKVDHQQYPSRSILAETDFSGKQCIKNQTPAFP